MADVAHARSESSATERRNYSVPIAIMLTSVHRSAWRAA
ncbi:hypothetical protein BURCENBC7_AP3368 [Burkholderia cenocepacia BC7]|nr:hypothetical protein BURCENBC7_AP3368 [Burkholderia cenocepacia BC7]